ncbi:MAG: hypothetical protein FD175_1580 [Beijerinckiaceae bacterium]|nr:MAG: hypothetical protein FD175_1580 [Beijerinckiaceae bacterium]
MTRLRLLPVLVFGLVSLLSLKLLSVALTPQAPGPFESKLGDAFARTIKMAREGVSDDQLLTGSTGKKPDKDPKEAKDDKTKAPPTQAERANMTPEQREAAAKETERLRADFNAKAEPEGLRIPPPNNANVAQAGPSAEERALLEKLKDRRGQIEARDRDLELRDSLIKVSERKLDERIGELRSLENQLGQSAAKNDPKTRYRSLVVMYESMKPKEAARVFDRLDVKILLDLVAHMNPRKMSEILAVMDPSAAEKLTVALARQASQGDAQVADSGPQADTELQRLPAPGAPRR